jgi:hypothetical protein
MHRTQRPPKPSSPPKVRHEPPTIDEAVQAARDLASDAEQQIEVAAGLMGVSPEEIREYVAGHPAQPTSIDPVGSRRRVVVVQRRGSSRATSVGRSLV